MWQAGQVNFPWERLTGEPLDLRFNGEQYLMVKADVFRTIAAWLSEIRACSYLLSIGDQLEP